MGKLNNLLRGWLRIADPASKLRLRIRYRSLDDEVTDRLISVIAALPPNAVSALCHLRGEERTFVLSRIEKAVDADTGEVIPDIWAYLGLPTLKPPKPQMPEMPDFPGRRTSLPTEELINQRSADKQALFRRFGVDVIRNVKGRQLRAIFDNRCFRCGHTGSLQLDHHVAQELGGRLVPGNIVLLCASCNSQKKTYHPSVFYTKTQLDALVPKLQAELELFDFKFNWVRWNNNPKEYLRSLGITEEEADAKLSSQTEGLEEIQIRLDTTQQ